MSDTFPWNLVMPRPGHDRHQHTLFAALRWWRPRTGPVRLTFDTGNCRICSLLSCSSPKSGISYEPLIILVIGISVTVMFGYIKFAWECRPQIRPHDFWVTKVSIMMFFWVPYIAVWSYLLISTLFFLSTISTVLDYFYQDFLLDVCLNRGNMKAS